MYQHASRGLTTLKKTHKKNQSKSELNSYDSGLAGHVEQLLKLNSRCCFEFV